MCVTSCRSRSCLGCFAAAELYCNTIYCLIQHCFRVLTSQQPNISACCLFFITQLLWISKRDDWLHPTQGLGSKKHIITDIILALTGTYRESKTISKLRSSFLPASGEAWLIKLPMVTEQSPKIKQVLHTFNLKHLNLKK